MNRDLKEEMEKAMLIFGGWEVFPAGQRASGKALRLQSFKDWHRGQMSKAY